MNSRCFASSNASRHDFPAAPAASLKARFGLACASALINVILLSSVVVGLTAEPDAVATSAADTTPRSMA